MQVVSSKSSLAFFDRAKVEAENDGVRVWTDEDEWKVWDYAYLFVNLCAEGQGFLKPGLEQDW